MKDNKMGFREVHGDLSADNFGWTPEQQKAFEKEWHRLNLHMPISALPVTILQQLEPNSTQKPTNPKDLVGSGKLPLHLWPASATALGCLGMLDGMLKYGRSNFRAIGVRSSIYVDAAQRHITAWFEGEDNDPDSGVPHLSHALACLAIIVDAMAAGKLNDDRMYPGQYREFLNDLTPHVARLKELHKNKDPKHYTIKDQS